MKSKIETILLDSNQLMPGLLASRGESKWHAGKLPHVFAEHTLSHTYVSVRTHFGLLEGK